MRCNSTFANCGFDYSRTNRTEEKKVACCVHNSNEFLALFWVRSPYNGFPRLIRAKAKKIFDQLNSGSESTFLANKGWFENFKKRHNLHNLKLVGESASADHEAAKKFPEELKIIIEKGGYQPQQVFNADETGLFWKKMPSRTFLSKTEQLASGFKAVSTVHIYYII